MIHKVPHWIRVFPTSILAQAILPLALGCSGYDHPERTLPAKSRLPVGLQQVSEAEAASLPFFCEGELSKVQPAFFQNLEISVTPYACESTTGVKEHPVDSSGFEWTWDDLRQADHEAFRVKHHRMGRDILEKVTAVGELTPISADVWFTIPSSHDPTTLDKETFGLLHETERENLVRGYHAAIAERAREVVEQIEKTLPTSKSSPA